MVDLEPIDWDVASRAFLSTHAVRTIEPSEPMRAFWKWCQSFAFDQELLPARSSLRIETCPPEFLPYLGLLRVDHGSEGVRLQVRLSGHRVLDTFPGSLPGTWLNEYPVIVHHPIGTANILETFVSVVRSGRPQAVEGNWTYEHRPYRYRRLTCPLSEDGQKVDHLLILFEFLDMHFSWPPRMRT